MTLSLQSFPGARAGIAQWSERGCTPRGLQVNTRSRACPWVAALIPSPSWGMFGRQPTHETHPSPSLTLSLIVLSLKSMKKKKGGRADHAGSPGNAEGLMLLKCPQEGVVSWPVSSLDPGLHWFYLNRSPAFCRGSPRQAPARAFPLPVQSPGAGRRPAGLVEGSAAAFLKFLVHLEKGPHIFPLHWKLSTPSPGGWRRRHHCTVGSGEAQPWGLALAHCRPEAGPVGWVPSPRRSSVGPRAPLGR